MAHGDLPLAHGMAELAGFDGVTLVPDRRDDGTNVVCVPAGAAASGSPTGPGSFGRHRAEATVSAWPSGCVRDPTWPGTWTRPADVVTWPSDHLTVADTASPASSRSATWPATDLISVDLCGRPSVALAVAAHPDDVEFGCGATLAKWAAGGCRIHHLILTDGSKGTWDPDAGPAPGGGRDRRAARGGRGCLGGGEVRHSSACPTASCERGPQSSGRCAR